MKVKLKICKSGSDISFATLLITFILKPSYPGLFLVFKFFISVSNSFLVTGFKKNLGLYSALLSVISLTPLIKNGRLAAEGNAWLTQEWAGRADKHFKLLHRYGMKRESGGMFYHTRRHLVCSCTESGVEHEWILT